MYSEQSPPTGQSKQEKFMFFLWEVCTSFFEIVDDMCNDPLLSVYVCRTQGVHLKVSSVAICSTFALLQLISKDEIL